MSFDVEALSDRLYADAIATGLRWHLAFCDVRTDSNWEHIEIHLRECAKKHATDLSATAVQAERALEQVQKEWRKATENSSLGEIDLLICLAKILLQRDGPRMILRVNREHPGREILRWRFVSLALPPGILIAAATQSGFDVPNAVRILNTSIAPDSPVAQNHLHHAALPTFEDLWVSLRVRALTQPGGFARSIQEPRAYCPGLHRGPCPGGRAEDEGFLTPLQKVARVRHMAEWADLIRQAFIARRVIDQHSWHHDSLTDCSDPVCKTGRITLRTFMAGQTKSYTLTGTRYPWLEERDLLLREVRESANSVVGRQLAGASIDLLLKEANCERRILARSFGLLNSQKQRDREYEKMFLQYLRVKTAVFGLLVHSPGEHGLKKFVQYFTQIKVYAHEANKLKPRKPDEPGLDVRATEYRVAPDAWLETLRNDAERDETQEAAWIIHFQRKGPGKGLPLYGAERRSIQGQATQIANALTQQPNRLRMLRGIDICGVEGKQPLWVSAQALQWLRSRSQDIAASRPTLELEPLRLTLHAGEDFEWLTSGIRAVAEPFQWDLIERGDRIGHGIAVTLDPKGWWVRHKGEVKPVTRFDRLLDLAFLGKYAAQRSPEENAWLRREIESVVNGLWPNTKNTPNDMISSAITVWCQLGRPITRRLMESSDLRPNAPLHEEWIYKYLWDRGTQRRASEKVHMKVDVDERDSKSGGVIERNLLVKAREKLIPEIALWQVCLESNPSSNLVVASLDSMASQDFLQTRPTAVAGRGAETLTWTISTDNPITFSTCLADEYAYAWAGMVLRKERAYDPSYARALLDEAAATSMRMRFTTRFDRGFRPKTNN
jgi:hypothetical protein